MATTSDKSTRNIPKYRQINPIHVCMCYQLVTVSKKFSSSIYALTLLAKDTYITFFFVSVQYIESPTIIRSITPYLVPFELFRKTISSRVNNTGANYHRASYLFTSLML